MPRRTNLGRRSCSPPVAQSTKSHARKKIKGGLSISLSLSLSVSLSFPLFPAQPRSPSLFFYFFSRARIRGAGNRPVREESSSTRDYRAIRRMLMESVTQPRRLIGYRIRGGSWRFSRRYFQPIRRECFLPAEISYPIFPAKLFRR